MRELAPSNFELRLPTALLEVCRRVTQDQTGDLQTLHATTSRGEDVSITVKSEDKEWIDLFFQGAVGSIIDVLNDRWRCSIETISPELPRPNLSPAVVAQGRSADNDQLELGHNSTEAVEERVTDVDEISAATEQSNHQTQNENGRPRRISRRLRERQQRSSMHRRGSNIDAETVSTNACIKSENTFAGDQVDSESEGVELNYAGSEYGDTHAKIDQRKQNGVKKCGKKYEMVLEITETNVRLSLMTRGLNEPIKIEARVAEEDVICGSTENSMIDDSCQPSDHIENTSDTSLPEDGYGQLEFSDRNSKEKYITKDAGRQKRHRITSTEVENTSDSSLPEDEDGLLKVAFPIASSRDSKKNNAGRQKRRHVTSADVENTSGDVSLAENEDDQSPDPSEQDQEKTNAAGVVKHKRRRRLTDTDSEPYSCPECGHKFIVAISLMRHVKSAHTHLPNYDAIVNAVEDLRSRQLKRPSAVAVSCPVCTRSMRGTRIFSHMRKWHADDDGFDALMKHVKTSFYAERERVYKLNDWGGERIPCPHCGLTRVRRRMSHHVKFQCKENAERRKFLRCRHCGYGTHCPDRLAAHTEMHQDGSNFICHNCGKSYVSRSGLTIHLRNKHQEANVIPIVKYTCPVCPISYIQECRLKKHMAIHEESRSSKREARKSKQRQILKEERRYLCEVCGKAFKDSSTLCMHVRTQHLRQYRYFCQACGHGVEKRSYLERHRCSASTSNGALAIVLGQQVEQCELVVTADQQVTLEQCDLVITTEQCDEGGDIVGEIATGCPVKVEALMIDGGGVECAAD